MKNNLKKGYIALIVVSVLRVVYKIYFTLVYSHLAQGTSGILEKTFDFMYKSPTWVEVTVLCLPVLVSVVVSAVTFCLYRKILSKITAWIVILAFIPVALSYVVPLGFFSYGLAPIIIVIGEFIYSLVMIIFMVKDLKRFEE